MSAAVTGAGLAVPGVREPRDLLGPIGVDAAPVDPAARIGRKGLRYKDRATQLALCAAAQALTDAGLLDAAGRCVVPEDAAVVVGSNLGNLDTVCRVVRTIADEGTGGVSPMDTPNASSNIVASELAIRYALRGPNLTVCSGPAAGADAVSWAWNLVRTGRCRHVLVVGVEPDNEVTRRLTGADRVADAAAAIVIEDPGTARARRAAVLATVRSRVSGTDAGECLTRLDASTDGRTPSPTLVLTPERHHGRLPDEVVPGAARTDLAANLGHCSGALGVLQCVAAVGHLGTARPASVAAVSGGGGAGRYVGLLLSQPDGATPTGSDR